MSFTAGAKDSLLIVPEKVETLIAVDSTMVLTRRESLRLLEMIENPPPRNDKFRQAQARYRVLSRQEASDVKDL